MPDIKISGLPAASSVAGTDEFEANQSGTSRKVTASQVRTFALSGYTGATTIVTLGTITAGTWNGTAIAVANGGTGATDAATARSNLGLAIGTNVQAYDADLTAIAGLGGTSGFLKKTGADTWTLDTSTYLTGNQSITLSGDATGSGSTGITVTLANSGVGAGTYRSVTVDAKGRVTAGTNPTTLSGYGITDAAPSSHVGATGTAHGVATTAVAGFMSSADKTKLDGIATGATANTGTVTSVAVSGGTTGLTTSGGPITSSGTITLAGTLAVANGGTGGTATPTNGGVSYGTGSAYAFTAAGTAGQALVSNGSGAPTWATLDLTYLPDSSFKKAVRAATTANITLSGTQTIDGIAVVAGDRVLVKDQATASQNGIYVVASGAWTRATDADAASEMAGAVVNVDSGTTNGGKLFDTDFKSTDTLGTTAMPWYSFFDTANTPLAAISALTPAADRLPYFSSSSAASLATFTTFARSLLDDADAATARTTLGLAIGTNVQAYDGDLAAIAALAGTSGLLKKTAADTWTLDTAAYLTANQSITLSGDATGSGSTAIAVTLANSGVTAGTYSNATVTVDAKGRVTSASSGSASGVSSFSAGTTGLTPSTAATGAVTLAGTLAVANGGTGATTAANARTNLGLGTAATMTGPTGAIVGTTDTQTLSGKTIEAAIFTKGYTEQVVTANTGTAYTINLDNGSVQYLTLTGNCTFTFPTVAAGKSFLLFLKQDSTGSRTATWPSSTDPVRWPGGTAPTLTTNTLRVDMFAFTSDGLRWFGRTIGQNYFS